jgi:DNA repair exonuclease SbcCD nuclease subunit
MSLRFLQIGDTHLGATLTGFPPEIADALRAAVREVLREAFARVGAESIDIVLLPGDLFEQGGANPEAELRFIYELAAHAAPVPVVIAPGNHDAYSPDSAYARVSAPENTAVFKSGAFSVLDTRAGLITGRAAQAGEGTNAIDWSQLPPPASELSLLVLHASVLHAEDGRRHDQVVAPVSLDSLRRTGYSYIALGHFHGMKQFGRDTRSSASGGDPAVAAYAGCPQGLGWDEPGLKGYLLGELESGGAKLEFVAAARHVIQRQRVVLPPEYAADAFERLDDALDKLLAGLDASDLLDLSASGRWPETWRQELERQLMKLADHVLYARPIQLSALEFTPPLVGVGASPVLDEFLSHCDGQISAGGTDMEAWQLARYLGHRLLSGYGLPQEVA